MQRYDLIVIGSGPAGQRVNRHPGGQVGQTKVALVEKREVIGGVCINTGTIPSKTMREAVLRPVRLPLSRTCVWHELPGERKRSAWKIFHRFQVQHVIKGEVDVTQAQLTRNNISVLTGQASFADRDICGGRRTRGAKCSTRRRS